LLGVDIVIHTETGQPAVVVAQLFNMKPKVAIWIEGGAIQGARSNVDIELEIIDLDILFIHAETGQPAVETTDKDSAEVKWKEYQTELPFEVA
jgi:hypothetical protein